MALIQIGRLLFPPTQEPEYTTNFDLVSYDDVADTLVIGSSLTGVSVTIGQPKVVIVDAAAVSADFATPTYIAYPIGKVVAITDYKATGDGMTIQKTSLAGSNRTDWVIIATEDPANTGHIGENPVA